MSDGAGPLAALSGLWVLALLAVGSLAIPLRVGLVLRPSDRLLADIQAHRDPTRAWRCRSRSTCRSTLIGTATVARGPGEERGHCLRGGQSRTVSPGWLPGRTHGRGASTTPSRCFAPCAMSVR